MLGAVRLGADDRSDLLARAQVWLPTNIASIDITRGPSGRGAFAPGETVTCDFVEKEFGGSSQKFACRISPDDEVKVKFGADNGEVEGEVAATRLLWALGFGADRMYPVRVICRGCPDRVGPAFGSGQARLVDPAVVERKFRGREIKGETDGWSWSELDSIDERAGGAPVAHRDALKLLAVLMQHTDTKPEQQRLVCLDERGNGCARPFMLLNDVGLTFGRATLGNLNAVSSVNLEEWARTSIWKGPVGCVGNLPKSLSGTLKDPVISDEGRLFLVSLLLQLSERQIGDLFTVARVTARTPSASAHTIDDWVHAFEAKREAIVERRCLDSWSSIAPPAFSTAPILWLQERARPGVTRAMNIVSLLGYTSVYMTIAVVLAIVRWRAGAALLLLLALTALFSEAAKVVVSFPRPDVVDARVQTLTAIAPGDLGRLAPPLRRVGLDDRVREAERDFVRDADYGFPSGHVAAATAFFFGLVFFFGWNWAWIGLVLWVPAMAISRVYLGRHFLGDVLGGFGVGVIVTAIAVQALNLRRFSAEDVDPGRAFRIARRVVVTAGALAVSAFALRVPAADDAIRLLVLAVIVLIGARAMRHSRVVPQ